MGGIEEILFCMLHKQQNLKNTLLILLMMVDRQNRWLTGSFLLQRLKMGTVLTKVGGVSKIFACDIAMELPFKKF